jgi:hypothetical protein
MLSPVLPSFRGLKWDIVTTPGWSTRVQRAKSGREIRTAYFDAPLYEFKLSYEVLRSLNGFQELQTLLGFFNLRKGSFQRFFYQNPDDDRVVAEPFGVGDGVTTTFQLYRTRGGMTEAIYWPEPDSFTNQALMWDDDLSLPIWNPPLTDPMWEPVYPAPFNLRPGGLVQYVTPPPNGQLLTWSGIFYYSARFLNDKMDFKQFLNGFWSQDNFSFVASLDDKIA